MVIYSNNNIFIITQNRTYSVDLVVGKILQQNGGNALFVLEKVSRINIKLHTNQPVKVIFEVLFTPYACLLVTCATSGIINP